jgi:hypothetical protein
MEGILKNKAPKKEWRKKNTPCNMPSNYTQKTLGGEFYKLESAQHLKPKLAFNP